MIDLHSHILPGLDDGARTLADSVEMARAAAADGITAIAATPHVRDDYPTTPEARDTALAEVRAAVEAAGVAIEVLPGGEIALDRLLLLDDAALARFGLGGNPGVLLLEFPYRGWPLGLEDVLFRLRTRGVVPVLAHPERNDAVQADPGRLERLVHGGALVQVTAASLDGRLGRSVRATSLRLLELELAHLLASDAHAPEVRAIGLAAAAEAVHPDLAAWLTTDVPGALVAGAPLPPRPEPPRPRPRLFDRLRR